MELTPDKLPMKLTAARKAVKMTQTELAEKVGISRRSLFAYENGNSVPRPKILRKIADALGVTVTYLSEDVCDDPNEGRARERSINQARDRFGAKGAREAAELLQRNNAFFAGGDIPQEDKDAFFQAIMTAYVTAKEEARMKFTPVSLRDREKDS